MLYAFVVAVLIGIGAPVSKLLLTSTDPVALAALLYLGSGLGLLVFLMAAGIGNRRRVDLEAPLRRRDLVWLVLGILTGGIAAPLILLYSLPHTPAATAALLLNFEAVATTAIAAFVFGEYVGRRIWVALALVTISCILLSWDPGSPLGFSPAAVGILATCILFATDNNLSQKVSAKDPVPYAAVKGLAAGAVLVILAIASGQTFPHPQIALLALLFGFVSFGGLISVLFIMAIRGIGAARAGSLLAVSPLFGVFVSLLLFPDEPAVLLNLAVPLMALGVWLIVSERHSHPHRHPAEVHEHRHRHDDLHHAHTHGPGDPPLSPAGEHSHVHVHEEILHEHPHRPDIHHRHAHERETESR